MKYRCRRLRRSISQLQPNCSGYGILENDFTSFGKVHCVASAKTPLYALCACQYCKLCKVMQIVLLFLFKYTDWATKVGICVLYLFPFCPKLVPSRLIVEISEDQDRLRLYYIYKGVDSAMH